MNDYERKSFEARYKAFYNRDADLTWSDEEIIRRDNQLEEDRKRRRNEYLNSLSDYEDYMRRDDYDNGYD